MADVLVLDSSTEIAVIGVRSGAGARAGARTAGDRRHGRDLVPAIQAVLVECGIALRGLGRIGVGLGPGSYTGLRIGVTAAKTLAYVSGAELVGVNSLEAVAANAPGGVLRVTVIADAQRGDLYVADFAREAPDVPLECQGPTRLEPLEAWVETGVGSELVLGPALEAARIRARLEGRVPLDPSVSNHPRWETLLDLALTPEAGLRGPDFWTLEPYYMRKSAAESKHEGAIAAPGVAGA